MNVSPTSWPNSTKFYLKHHLGGGLIALGFGPGRIGTLVSMATDSSLRVIWENLVNTLAPSFLVGSSSFFAGIKDNHNISDEFKIKPDRTKDCGVSCS